MIRSVPILSLNAHAQPRHDTTHGRSHTATPTVPHPPSSSTRVTNLRRVTPRLASVRLSSYTLTSRCPVPPSSSPKIPSTSSQSVTRPGSQCTLVCVSLQIPQDGFGGQRLTALRRTAALNRTGLLTSEYLDTKRARSSTHAGLSSHRCRSTRMPRWRDHSLVLLYLTMRLRISSVP